MVVSNGYDKYTMTNDINENSLVFKNEQIPFIELPFLVLVTI